MDTCAVEVGFLKKKPCGQNSVAKCANCEMALCTKHAVPQLNSMKARTGKFMCAECDRANKTVDTSVPAKPAAKPAGGAPAAAAPKPAAPAAKPAAPPARPATPAPAGAAPAAKAPAVAPTQPAGKQEFKLEDTGPIEFTPTKKP